MSTLIKLLHTSQDEQEWMSSLQSVEDKSGPTGFEILQYLKSLILSTESTHALKSLVQLFLRKTSSLLDERGVVKNEKLASQALTIVKDFWSLISNQHVFLTQQVFGSYIPEFYEILPSLASLFVDLFIAVHRCSDKPLKQSKRLQSWLMFELNERCLKTALLEVSECTKEGANLLLPLLRKLVSEPPKEKSHMDYFLHLILLKRWSFVCEELNDICQTSSDIKAPKKFVDWLSRQWAGAKNHFPADKSLKGRRVSELMLEFDQETVEELIEVFSKCLWTAADGGEATLAEGKGDEGQEMVEEMFVIDKRGNEADRDKVQSVSPPRKRKKMRHDDDEDDMQTSSAEPGKNGDSSNDSDIFMISGPVEESAAGNDRVADQQKSHKKIKQQQKKGKNRVGQKKDATENVERDGEEEMELGIEEEERNESNLEVSDEESSVVAVNDRKRVLKNVNKTSGQNKDILGFAIDRGPGQSPAEKTSKHGSNSGSDPAATYFVDKSSTLIRTFQQDSGDNNSDREVEIINGMEIQIFRSDADIPETSISKKNSGKKMSRTRKDSKSEKSPHPLTQIQSDVENRTDKDQTSHGTRKAKASPTRSKQLLKPDQTDSSHALEISSEDDEDVICLSHHSSSEIMTSSQKKSKIKSPHVTATSWEKDGATKDSPDEQKQTRLRRNSEPSVGSPNKNVGKADSKEHSTDKKMLEAQIDQKLSEIRKMVDSEKELKAVRSNSKKKAQMTTRLRSKSESHTDSQAMEKAKDAKQIFTLKKSKEESVKKGGNLLKDWLRTPPTKATKSATNISRDDGGQVIEYLTPDNIKENSVESPHKLRSQSLEKTPKSRANQTSRSIKEHSTVHTPKARISSPLKFQKVSIDADGSDSDAGDTSTTHSSEKLSPTKRYFLRTNCSHRLNDTETVCPTCSPKNSPRPTKKVRSHDDSDKQTSPAEPKSGKTVSSSSQEESPTRATRNRKKSLRSASIKQK